MSGRIDPVVLRAMAAEDVPAVVEVQEAGSVRSLSSVFPQDRYPFPRDDLARRWLLEVATPDVDCSVVLLDDRIVGFAATHDDELLHFGVAVEQWGTGVAARAHHELLARMRARGVQRAWLRVFAANVRARRFYERLGWTATGERSRTSFPPHPELLRYERPLDDDASTVV